MRNSIWNRLRIPLPKTTISDDLKIFIKGVLIVCVSGYVLNAVFSVHPLKVFGASLLFIAIFGLYVLTQKKIKWIQIYIFLKKIITLGKLVIFIKAVIIVVTCAYVLITFFFISPIKILLAALCFIIALAIYVFTEEKSDERQLEEIFKLYRISVNEELPKLIAIKGDERD